MGWRALALAVARWLLAVVVPGLVLAFTLLMRPLIDQVTAVLKRDFRARGQATMDRVELDEVQRLCTLHADNPPAELAKQVEEAQLKQRLAELTLATLKARDDKVFDRELDE